MLNSTRFTLLILVTFSLLAGGCGTSLKSNWRDFNAYYNTFYNARENYKTGLRKNLEQQREYNPLVPIRIHEKPVNAGAQDFNKAIEKGADILRKHKETRWVDDALALIGKSYYFRKEYYSADQKFRELYTTTSENEMKQESVVWQGRLLLDMALYNRGISLLTEELISFDGEWRKGFKAEAQALLAQHYVQNESWELAREQLSVALPHLPGKAYKERGWFLMGQIYEKMNRPEDAFDAYGRVQGYYTEYRLQYLAKRKQAEVARDLSRYDAAYDIFDDMVRDDKNTEYKSELDYELARTEQQRGNAEKAEEIYLQLLQDQVNKASSETRAKAYYSLAEIYRFQYDDFALAAAYYDSAAGVNARQELLPEDFQASDLAVSFGKYASIKSDIALQDSLLHLGQLSPEAFDSAMVQLRQQKLEELERQRREQEARENRLVNVGQNSNQQQNNTGSRGNGFLNIENRNMVMDAKSQFRALWGGRPLADNWRFASLIRDVADSGNAAGQGEEAENNAAGEFSLMQIEIDISNIPFTEQAQDSVKKIVSEYQYELGNLFFINLNMPDSAAVYYKKAIRNPARKEVNAVSYYSLSELESISGNQNEAQRYARILTDEYPETIYAQRLAAKFDIPYSLPGDSAGTEPLVLYREINSTDTLSAMQMADSLKQFSLKYDDSGVAPFALEESITLYVEEGKTDSLYQSRAGAYQQLKAGEEIRRNAFRQLKDSVSTVLNDSTVTLTDTRKAEYTALKDSVWKPVNYKEVFPYYGAPWDSARKGINLFKERFSNTPPARKVLKLDAEISLPESDELKEPEADSLSTVPDSVAANNEMPADSLNTTARAVDGYYNCEEIDTPLTIRGGMENFMAGLNLPENPAIDEISFRFKVNRRGIVDDHELLTQNPPNNIRQSFILGFDEGLAFEPVLYRGQAVAVDCEITFPLK